MLFVEGVFPSAETSKPGFGGIGQSGNGLQSLWSGIGNGLKVGGRRSGRKLRRCPVGERRQDWKKLHFLRKTLL